MTIKKKALGKITKVEKGTPKKRFSKTEKDELDKCGKKEKAFDLLGGTDLDDNYYDAEDDIDMAVE